MLSHSLVDLGAAAAAAGEEELLQWDAAAAALDDELQQPSALSAGRRTLPPRRRSSLSRFYAAKSASFCCMTDLQANPFSQSTAIVLAKKRSLATFSSLTSETFGFSLLLEEEAQQPHDDDDDDCAMQQQQGPPKRRAAGGAMPAPAASAGGMPASLARHSWDGSQATTHTALLEASGDDSDGDQEASGPGLMGARGGAMMLQQPRGHSPAGTSDSGGSQQAGWLEHGASASLPVAACDGLCHQLRSAALASSGPRPLLCFVEP